MKNRKPIYSLILFSLILTLILAGIIFYSKNQDLKVIFLDVGQGDATLIMRGNFQILIDGGPDGQRTLEKLGEYVPFWDRKIEVVMATHPDQDHIDGLVDVMEKYDVAKVIDNGVSSESQIYKKFKETMGNKNIDELEGKAGMKIRIGDGAQLEILAPDGTQAKDSPKDTNASSLVSKLTFGENTFLFTGDFPSEQEPALIHSGADLHSRVLKVAHHGSKYATGDEFLAAVSPKTAVISVGKNNRYGHPNPEVLDRLRAKNIEILRTDEEGDIGYICKDFSGECVLEMN